MAPLFALLAALLVAAPPAAEAHGWLAVPESRNSRIQLTGPPGISYNRNSGNGAGLQSGPPIPQPGICGDPWQTITDRSLLTYVQDHPMDPNARYSPGQEVRLAWTLTANHGGYIAFKLCPSNPRAAQITQACFDQYPLQRADGLGTRTYIHVSTDNVNMGNTYRLPAGVDCKDGCVLQWEYVTMNSCWVPCEVEAACAGPLGSYATRGSNPARGQTGLEECSPGMAGAIRSERFQNCADIVISGDPAPPPSPSPSPSPPPSVCAAITATVANGAWPANKCKGAASGANCVAACKAGYTGSPTATCTNGAWSAVTGSCAKNCGAITKTVANGAWPADKCNGTASGGACVAACKAGYSGSPTSTCTNGAWSAVSGTCARTTAPSGCAGTAQRGGKCGASAGNFCCPSGQCCSAWDNCGIEPAHCDAGCQKAYGTCSSTSTVASLSSTSASEAPPADRSAQRKARRAERRAARDAARQGGAVEGGPPGAAAPGPPAEPAAADGAPAAAPADPPAAPAAPLFAAGDSSPAPADDPPTPAPAP
ncbi:hypothetical protein Rsub_12952 [Raphidocelis subcapitata]|uniref:Chitin-binding type-1 domain-containing protein n=1 Tax=Raphidocelis subcapitata TaxID=307507 RepID=A0A2V0PK48_9CHLO|nr:hypothetical protein Rsub_12952 [Raphidocelis subcapitata]|eukprot:GBG00182.1 hypothetical protein Rsub_12952 [Raphidocelis subcapitata]